MDRIESYKLVCAGGLNSNENHLDLAENSEGSATRLINYEPSLFGGYRRIEGFNYYDTQVTYDAGGYGQEVQAQSGGSNVAEGKILGLTMYRNEVLGNPYPIAMRKDVGTNTYSFWKYTSLAGWSKITTGLTRLTVSGERSVSKVRHVQFNFGSGSMIVFVDGVNKAVVFDGTNWKELSSGNTGGASNPGGPAVYDAPEIVDVFENRVFLGGDRAYRSGIAHSAQVDPYTWTSATKSFQYSMGFNVVQFKPFRDDMFIFGENSIKKFIPDTNTSATQPFKIENVTTNIGCVARDSVQELGGDLVFLAPDGLRPCAGTSRIGDVELESISKPIQGRLIDIIKNENLSTLNSCVVRSKSQYRMFVGGSTDEGIGILGGLTYNSSGGSVEWEFSELLGFKAACATSEFIGTSEYVLHGGYDGKVYRQENGNSLAGDDIIAIYSTPYLDMGDVDIKKVVHKINTFVRAEGPFTMSLSLQYDWSDPETLTPNDYVQGSTGAPVVYNGRNIKYGGTNIKYGGSSKPVVVSDIQGSGYSVRATFVTSGTFDPYSIQGLVFEYGKSGRR